MSAIQAVPPAYSLVSEKSRDHVSSEEQLLIKYTIARVWAETDDVNSAATQVLQIICEIAGWDFGALWRVDPETHTLANEGVWHASYANLSEFAQATRYSVIQEGEISLPGQVLPARQPVWISDLNTFTSADAVKARMAGLHSAFLLPVHNGVKWVAVLECLSKSNRVQDSTLYELLIAIGNQIGIFLERKRLEEALSVRANQQQLLAQVGMSLSPSIDYEKRLLDLVRIIVPNVADWCAIDIIDKQNWLRRVAAAHVDPDKEKLVYALQQAREVDYNQPTTPQIEALLAGRSLLFPEIPSSLIEESVRDPVMLEILRKLNPKSSIVVPLLDHERAFGLCTFVYSDSGRRYQPGDLAFVEDVGRRVAVAVDNAMLYAESQKSNIELESRVEDRTTQLRVAINQLTGQIHERQQAEEQVKTLNARLEQRIAERTSQLEVAVQELQKEVIDHQQASRALRTSLKRTRELYRISQMIGTVRAPNDVLRVLLSSSYLKDASRASIAILNRPWIEGEKPPESVLLLAEWNRGSRQPKFFNRKFTLEELGLLTPVPYGQPIVNQDIQSIPSLPERVRKRFAALHTHSLIILPLVAGGEWYGLLSLHFKSRRMTNSDDLRHVRGLVDETAIAIKNMRLLETESQARQEAEAANLLKLKFLAMISHELRTPLASIKGFATTLLAEDVVWSAEKQLDFIQTINVESDKLGDLIDQLLDLSRIEAGILRVSPKKVSVQDIITPILHELKDITRQHELAIDISPDLPDIYGDSQPISQVLVNLVGNAAKYSPSKSLITLSAHLDGDWIQVDVTDQGVGIPDQERKRIFEPFYQLNNRAGVYTRGVGLGLAICKGFIEAHGGKIWIQRRPGPGTVVSFTLPVYRDQKKEVYQRIEP